ncbi:MAG: family 20 glycosylhydrolase [Oscillospiraceae bacterium]|nr:family 20 glycosylhydrolase [Oscillospiraceae bacterium]
MIPRVKECTYKGHDAAFGPKVTLSAPESMARKACRALELFLPQCEAAVTAGQGDICVRPEGSMSPESYRLQVEDGRVEIVCADYAGLRNALAVLSQLTCRQEGVLSVPDTAICDAPVCNYRGIMLDFARGIRPYEKLIDDVILAAKARMNTLHLHLCDAQGVAVELDSVPQDIIWEGAYTKEQMRQLAELCDVLALEIIPEYDLPAHAISMTTAADELRCKDADGGNFASPWVLCPGSEGIFEWMDSVIGEVCELFPGRYFHIGGDELYFPDIPGLNQLCHWDECVKCRALREREGLADMQEEYYYVLRRLYDMVRARGRTMIFWTDQIDPDRPRPLPVDGVIGQYWRHYDKPGRGPVGGSLQGQLEMGYTLINSYYMDTYADMDEYMSEQTIRDWRWDKRPGTDPALAHRITGSELCAWEYGNAAQYSHYDRTLPASIALMADKLWNGDELDYTPDYCRAVTRLLLGVGAGDLDLCAALGGLIPPRVILSSDTGDVDLAVAMGGHMSSATEVKARAGQVTLSRDELEQVKAALGDENRYLAGDLRRARVFADCVDFVLENK